MLSQSASASSILCVVSTNADLSRLFNMLNKLLLETGSTPVVGSSKNSILGHPMSDMAHTSFLLFPPLRLPALVSENEVKSRVFLMKSFWKAISTLLRPLILLTKSMHSSTVRTSQMVLCYGTIPILGPYSSILRLSSGILNSLISPDDLLRSMVVMLKVVDFPAPLGPSNPKTSPALT